MRDCQVKAITSVGELDAVQPLWEAAQRRPKADYEFFNLIVQSRANVVSPCVLAALRDGQPVALWAGRIEHAKLPVQFGYYSLAEVPLRQVVFVEGGLMGEQTEDIRRALLGSIGELFIQHKLDLAILEQVRVGSPEFQTVKRVFGRTQLSPAQAVSDHWLLRLPKAWEEFLKSRSKKHRYWLKRLPTVLDREFSGRWTIRAYRSPGEARDFVHAADVVASATYQRGLGAGFFLNEENLRRVELEARRGQLRGYILAIGTEPKAFWYGAAYQRTLHLAATGYDPTFQDYELGTVLLMKMFQDHCGSDIDVVDFGLGDAGYKQRFGTEHYPETTLHVFSRTARGLGLNGLHTAVALSNQLGKAVLARLRVAQRLKTFWRRRIGRQEEKSRRSQNPAAATTGAAAEPNGLRRKETVDVSVD